MLFGFQTISIEWIFPFRFLLVEYRIKANPKFECVFKIARSWRAKSTRIRIVIAKDYSLFEIDPSRATANIMFRWEKKTLNIELATHRGDIGVLCI